MPRRASRAKQIQPKREAQPRDPTPADAVVILPTDRRCFRLLGAGLAEQHDEWG